MMDEATFRILGEAKNQAEDAQAMFGGIKAVLGAADDSVRNYLQNAPFESSGHKTYLDYHAHNLQELLGVVSHLLLEMEEQQDALVHLLAEKTFEARKER